MPTHENWTEPDVTINGQPLTFAQSLTMRVALTHFTLWCQGESDTLGPVGANYRARAREIMALFPPAVGPNPEGTDAIAAAAEKP